MSPLGHAALFLIQTLFDLYLYVIWLRLLLPWVKADYHHPLSQLVIRMTEPAVHPLAQVLPRIRGVDSATLLWLLMVGATKIWLLLAIQYQLVIPQPVALMIITAANLLNILFDFYFFAIVVCVILSWLQPTAHPMAEIIFRLTEPLIRPWRERLPAIAGFDFSPLAALMMLKLIAIVFINPLSQWGFSWL